MLSAVRGSFVFELGEGMRDRRSLQLSDEPLQVLKTLVEGACSVWVSWDCWK